MTKPIEEQDKVDSRYPSMFYQTPGGWRVGVAHYTDQDGPQPFVTVQMLLENKPGGQWREVHLPADEAEQMALHLLEKVKSVRRILQEQA